MRTQYLGATNSVAGATYFFSNPILEVSEGFMLGNTIQLVNLGNYLVTDYSYTGGIDQSIDISAEGLQGVPQFSISTFDYNLQNAKNHLTRFDSSDEFNSQWSTGDNVLGITSSPSVLGLIAATVTLPGYATAGYNGAKIRNGFAACRIQMNTLGTAAGNYIAVAMRTSLGLEQSQFINGGYAGVNGWIAGNPGRVEMQLIPGFGTTLFATSAFSASNNTAYWVATNVKNSRARVAVSTDGLAFVNYIDTEITRPDSYGAPAVWTYRGQTDFTRFNYFYTVEYSPVLTLADAITSTLHTSGVFGVTIPNTDFSISSFGVTQAGSTYTFGTSNNLFVWTNGTGSSWNQIMTGRSYFDFVLDGEIKFGLSSSDAYTGLCIGPTTNHWMGIYITPVSQEATLEFRLGNNARQVFGGLGTRPQLIRDRWYNVRFLRKQNYFALLVNNEVAMAYKFESTTSGLFQGATAPYGISAPLLEVGNSAVHIGLFSWRGANAGSTIEYRNFRISTLGQLVDDLTVSAYSDMGSLFNTLVDGGLVVNQENNVLKVRKLGESQGTMTFGQSLFSSDVRNYSYFGSKYRLTVNSADLASYTAFTKNEARLRSLEKNNYESISIQDAASSRFLEDAYTNAIADRNRSLDTHSLDIPFTPALETWDNVLLVDPEHGVSETKLVTAISKGADFSSGNISMQVTLANGTSKL